MVVVWWLLGAFRWLIGGSMVVVGWLLGGFRWLLGGC